MSDQTTGKTFRILQAHSEALNESSPTLSGSAIVRALLGLYYSDGEVHRKAFSKAFEEMSKAEEALRRTQFPKQQQDTETAA